MIYGSVPITIKKHRQAAPLTLASYQPKSVLSAPQEVEEDGVRKSLTSEAIRKADYAERDRSRSVDPGFLDFQDDQTEGVVEQDKSDVDDADDSQGGARGRRHAFKILQATSEVPEEGMWRSLAS
jgi:hypothetical protein